jgi:hypothetical protein
VAALPCGMARRAARQDSNHGDVLAALVGAGAVCTNTHMVGNGFPDICVGFKDTHGKARIILIEVKDGSKVPSKQRLTEDEQKWWNHWPGDAYVVTSAREAVELVFDLRLTRD